MNPNPNQRPPVTLRLVADPNPWEDASVHLRPSPLVTALLFALALLCAAYHPLWAGTSYTLGLLAVLAVLWLFVARAPLTVISGAATLALGWLFGGLSWGVYALCLIATLAIGAYLVCTLRAYWLFALPVLAYLLSLFLCGDAALALFSLLVFPAVGLMAHTTMKNQHRVGVICASSVMLTLCLLFAACLILFRINDGTAITSDTVFALLDRARKAALETLAAEQAFMEMLALLPVEEGVTPIMLAEALVDTLLSVLTALFPALVITLGNALAYAAQLLLVQIFMGTGKRALVTQSSRLFVMSVPSAVIFLACSIVLLFPLRASMAVTVMENLQLILFPGMLIVGVYKLLADLRAKRSPLLPILLAVGALFAPYALLLFVAASGALTTLLRPLLIRLFLQGPPSPPPSR